jgi:hypothetical protein
MRYRLLGRMVMSMVVDSMFSSKTNDCRSRFVSRIIWNYEIEATNGSHKATSLSHRSETNEEISARKARFDGGNFFDVEGKGQSRMRTGRNSVLLYIVLRSTPYYSSSSAFTDSIQR